MSTPSAPALGRVTLACGPAEFLAERAISRVLSQVRAADPDADVAQVMGSEMVPGALAELTSPSLFSRVRALVLRDLQDVPADVHDDLAAYAESPSEDVALALVHPGGQKGKRLLDRLGTLDAVQVLACDKPAARDLPRFVATEVGHHRAAITPDAAQFLIEAVGPDLRSLAAAADQLASDFSSMRITTELVRRYFDGKAEVKSFDIADAAIAGRLAWALEQLRWALGNGVPAVFVISAFAAGLRSLARLQNAPRGLREADLAKEVGAPAFRLRTLRAQLRLWEPAGLARAICAVAQADLEVKGGAGDAGHALERMVLTVARSRGPG